MKLKELIADTDFPNVKVGANSGYIYCGKSDIDAIQVASDWKKKEIIRILGDSFVAIDSAEDAVMDSLNEILTDVAKDVSLSEIDNARKTLRIKRDILRVEINRLQKNIDSILPWIDLPEREVKETFRSIDERDTLNIIVDGNVKGNFWTTEEYSRHLRLGNGGDAEDEED